MKRRRVLSIILGVCISLMMVGTAFADESYNPYTIIEGQHGTYVKKSLNSHKITVEIAHHYSGDNLPRPSVTVDDEIVDPDNYELVGNFMEPSVETTAAPTTEPAPLPEESPSATPEVTPTPTTSAPGSESEAPVATQAMPEASGASVYSILQSIWSPMTVHADSNAMPESTENVKSTRQVILKGSYLETLSVGDHKVKVNFEDPDGSVEAIITVKEASASSTNTTATTTASKDDSSNLKPKTGDDTTGIMGFAVAAILSGAALVVLGRKKIFK